MTHLRLGSTERQCSRTNRSHAALGTGSYTEQARGWQRKLALEQGCHSVPEAGMSGISPQTAIFRTCLLTFKIIPVLTHSFPQVLPHPRPSSGYACLLLLSSSDSISPCARGTNAMCTAPTWHLAQHLPPHGTQGPWSLLSLHFLYSEDHRQSSYMSPTASPA